VALAVAAREMVIEVGLLMAVIVAPPGCWRCRREFHRCRGRWSTIQRHDVAFSTVVAAVTLVAAAVVMHRRPREQGTVGDAVVQRHGVAGDVCHHRAGRDETGVTKARAVALLIAGRDVVDRDIGARRDGRDDGVGRTLVPVTV